MIVRAAADWDEERWDRLANDHVARARRNGDLVDLPWLLDDRACLHVLRGETERAAAAVAEATRIAGASEHRRPAARACCSPRGRADRAQPSTCRSWRTA